LAPDASKVPFVVEPVHGSREVVLCNLRVAVDTRYVLAGDSHQGGVETSRNGHSRIAH